MSEFMNSSRELHEIFHKHEDIMMWMQWDAELLRRELNCTGSEMNLYER